MISIRIHPGHKFFVDFKRTKLLLFTWDMADFKEEQQKNLRKVQKGRIKNRKKKEDSHRNI